MMPANAATFGIVMLWVTVGDPNSSTELDPAVLTSWRQPGAPRKPRSMPGLIWPKLRMWPVRTVAAGMWLVVNATVLPRTGDGVAARATGWTSAPGSRNDPGSVAEMSMLPGSADAPAGE